MTFCLFIVYIVLSYVFPAEIFPALVAYRFTYWVGIAGLVVCLPALIVRRQPLFSPQFWFLVCFTVSLAISLMVAEHWPGAAVYAFDRFAPSFAMFVLALVSVTSLRRMRIAAICIVLSTLCLVGQGAAAYHMGINERIFLLPPHTASEPSEHDLDAPVDRQREDPDEDTAAVARIRGLGALHDPNDLALALVMALGIVVGATTRYGIFLTFSRGGALAALIILWRGLARRLGSTLSLALGVMLAIAIIGADFGGGRKIIASDDSASNRVEAWSEGLEMLKSSPVLGVGYGQFIDHHDLTAHNSFVLCFAETGAVGYFFWLGLIVITMIKLRGLQDITGDDPESREIRRWANGLFLAMIGFLTAGFFLSRTFIPILYLMIGLAGALVLVAARQGRRVALPAPFQLTAVIASIEVTTIIAVYTIVKLHVL